MIKSYASPIVSQIIVNDLFEPMKKAKVAWASISNTIHTVIDVAQTPDGCILLTQDENVSSVKEIKDPDAPKV